MTCCCGESSCANSLIVSCGLDVLRLAIVGSGAYGIVWAGDVEANRRWPSCFMELRDGCGATRGEGDKSADRFPSGV
jgi:hypothetical protein